MMFHLFALYVVKNIIVQVSTRSTVKRRAGLLKHEKVGQPKLLLGLNNFYQRDGTGSIGR